LLSGPTSVYAGETYRKVQTGHEPNGKKAEMQTSEGRGPEAC
jgi:hypothetical protein